MDKEQFLNSLAREARKGSSPSHVEALVGEARDHLEESIQARLELGTPAEQAEREAVAAFGEARRLAKDLTLAMGRAEVVRDRWLGVYFGLLAFTLTMAALVSQGFPDPVGQALLVIGFFTAIGFSLSSFRVGHPKPGRVLRVCLTGTGLLWALVSVGFVAVPLKGTIFADMRRRRTFDREAIEFRTRIAQERRGSLDMGRSEDAQALEAFVAVAEAARRDLLGNVLLALPAAALVGGVNTGLALAFDGIFGGLGTLAFAYRRRTRGGSFRA